MAQVHVESGQVTSVAALGPQLRQHRTAALLKARQLEVVRLVLPAGKALPEHAAPGEITLQCLEGAIELGTPSGTQRMQAADFIHLDAGVPHALRALDDASLLLTICLAAP